MKNHKCLILYGLNYAHFYLLWGTLSTCIAIGRSRSKPMNCLYDLLQEWNSYSASSTISADSV